MVDFLTRVRCAFHGHYWVPQNVEIIDSTTHVTYYCARFCGTTKHDSYPNPTPAT